MSDRISVAGPFPSLVGTGAKLGRYDVLRPVAMGGMGAVWLGRLRGSHGFEQLVAIKTILPEYACEPQFRELFLDEARLVAKIRHPNVAQVLDLGEEGDTLYCIMEWVEGRSLDRLVADLRAREITLPLFLALRILSDASLGAHAAHELRDEQGDRLGVVHRDISPQNILVSDQGATKLVDFGIARARAGLVAESRERIVRGKMSYMAPEQAEGRVVDQRADVWSLGAVLFALLTGRPVVSGRDAMVELLLTRRVPEVRPNEGIDIPQMVREAILGALAIDPLTRTRDALGIHRALERSIAAGGAPTTTADVARFIAVTLPRNITFAEPLVAAPERPGALGETKVEAAATGARDHQTKHGLAQQDVVVADTRTTKYDEALALLSGVRAPRLLIADAAHETEALRAFNRGAIDGVLLEPITDARLSPARSAARIRGERRVVRELAMESDQALQARETTLRREHDRLQSRLEHVMRSRGAAANEARLAVVGEVEVRRADALGYPLSLVVYRTHHASIAVPPSEVALLMAAVDATALVTEEAGEWIAIAPELAADGQEARLGGLDERLGAWAVAEHVRGESFITLLALTRGALA